jgi:hypothetical protein
MPILRLTTSPRCSRINNRLLGTCCDTPISAQRSSPSPPREACHTDISLYDMDIVFDPPGSGLFSEVYLYEELMEADLHAIVSASLHTGCDGLRII